MADYSAKRFITNQIENLAVRMSENKLNMTMVFGLLWRSRDQPGRLQEQLPWPWLWRCCRQRSGPLCRLEHPPSAWCYGYLSIRLPPVKKNNITSYFFNLHKFFCLITSVSNFASVLRITLSWTFCLLTFRYLCICKQIKIKRKNIAFLSSAFIS